MYGNYKLPEQHVSRQCNLEVRKQVSAFSHKGAHLNLVIKLVFYFTLLVEM